MKTMDLGQVFTSEVIADYMASLINLNTDCLILDPCFGKGAFLNSCSKLGYKNITGYELDSKLYDETNNRFPQFNLHNADFILSNSETNYYDSVIMNPPYIRHETINDLKEYGISKDLIRKNQLFDCLPKTANMYMYFVVKALEVLKEKGTLVVIFPDSWLKSENGKCFEKNIFEKNTLVEQYNVYGNVFEKSALVKVVIMKIIKGKINVKTEHQDLLLKNNKIDLIKSNNTEIHLDFETPFYLLANAKRGITTGFNHAFINPKISNSVFTKRIISSPKSIHSYSTKDAKYDKLLSVIPNQIMDSKTKKYCNAYKKKILSEKNPKTLYKKIINGANWYDINLFSCKGIIFSYCIRDNIKFVDNSNDFLVRDNFYIIYPIIDNYLLFALLNNYYTFFQLEMFGKHYGAGLLKIQLYDLKRLMFPRIENISNDDISNLIELSNCLINSSDNKIIEQITLLISKYSNISFDEIRNLYNEMKNKRLKEK